MVKVDRFQEGEATQLPYGRLTPLTYLPFLLYKGITDKGLRAISNPLSFLILILPTLVPPYKGTNAKMPISLSSL
jgi:hypothetical protein